MAAIIQKNEALPAARRCWMRVLLSDAMTPYWRGGSFVGRKFVGMSSPTLATALGTMTNVRQPYTFAAFTFTANAATDVCTKTQHGLETGDGASNASNAGGALPGGLAAATPYYIIKLDDDTFKLATSAANAYLGTAIDITSNGTGTQTLTATASHDRGLDGEFIYEYTQTETNVDGSELLAIANDNRRVVTATAATDLINLAAHELITGVPVIFTTSNALPAPLAANTYYWVIRIDANTFKLATSFANALLGTAIDITTAGTGTHYLEPVIQRAGSTNCLSRTGASAWSEIAEAGRTYGDLMRGSARTLLAKYSKTGNDYVIRDLADTKNSHHGTVTASGRTVAVIDDLT